MSRRSHRWSHQRRSLRRPQTMHADPGSIQIDPASAASVLSLVAYGPTDFQEQKLSNVQEITTWRGRFPVLWINVDGLGSADFITQLGQQFQLHPLALEDAVNTHQRAKCDDYGDVLFCVARMMQGPPLVSEQLSIFVGPDFVLTLQEEREGDCLDAVRQRLRQNRGRIRSLGPDYLLYELIDAVVESYFPVLQGYGTRLDELDQISSYREITQKLRAIHELRQDLLYLRRVIWPHRDALLALQRNNEHLLSRESQLYLRDCYDHVVQLIDILEIYRESCSDLRDFVYARLSNRTNEIMRVLTIISTLFLPMMFIASIYGMNFDDMPELHWTWGYPFSIVIMAAVCIGFLVFFKRRGWLQSSEPE